jgi:predicted Zn finger-like uncharacterized protein
VSLTTRCPNCGTAFRVQPTQLSARGGKVRCGRCANVFDGVASLIEEGAAPANAPNLPDAEPSPQLALFESGRKLPQPGAAGVAANEDAAVPEFLDAPQPPRRRLLWGTASFLAFVALAAQGVFYYRAAIAGYYPEARPGLEVACAWMGCTVDLPRDIKALRIESSELRQNESGSDVVRLDVTFRNSSQSRQQYPSLILRLTSSSDEVLAQKEIPPREYLQSMSAETIKAGIAPSSITSITLYFDNSGLKAIGYRLTIEYL